MIYHRNYTTILRICQEKNSKMEIFTS